MIDIDQDKNAILPTKQNKKDALALVSANKANLIYKYLHSYIFLVHVLINKCNQLILDIFNLDLVYIVGSSYNHMVEAFSGLLRNGEGINFIEVRMRWKIK